MVGGVPWKTSFGDPNVDGEYLKMEVTVMDKHYREKVVAEREEMEKVPRRFFIRAEDP